MFILGILTITTGTATVYFGVEAELGGFKYIIALFFISIGIASFYDAKINKSLPEFSKCPECKETYTYLELEDGICGKYGVKTIDTEQYYDKI